jgi:hypothetical protein
MHRPSWLTSTRNLGCPNCVPYPFCGAAVLGIPMMFPLDGAKVLSSFSLCGLFSTICILTSRKQ